MVEIYKHGNTNYNFNGDMTLFPTEFKGTIELNGICEIEFLHPYDNDDRWKYISEDYVVSCPTPWSEKQLFRIYNVVKNIEGITVYARHIFFDLSNYVLLDVRPTNKTGLDALSTILKDTPFTAHSNISTPKTSYYIRKNIVESLLGDDDNSFINRWCGEILYDNFDIYINSQIGNDNNLRVEFGYNLKDIEEDVNLDSVVTRIIPIGYNGITLDGSSPWVDSPNISKYANIRTQVIEFSDVKVKESSGDEDGFNTLDDARNELKRRCNLLYSEGIDKPSINYKVGMVNLKHTTEYANIEVLEDVSIGDTVHCINKRLEIETDARCIKINWTLNNDKVVIDELEIGNFTDNYFNKQSDLSKKIENVFNSNGNVKCDSLEGTINAMKTKFKAQKDIAQTQHVRAMLFEDLDKNSPTFGAMCIGTMGFEIASNRTADDKEWDWRTFGTGKGFIADCIVAGILKNSDGSFQIDLTGKSGASFFNNGKLALKMMNNQLKCFNWKKENDFIGSLGALIQGGDENKPIISIWNDIDSAASIGYQSKTDTNAIPAYIYFDKYNILGDSSEYPIIINEATKFNKEFLGTHKIPNVNYSVYLAKLDNSKYISVLNDCVYFTGYKGYFDGNISTNGDIGASGNITTVGDLKCFGNKQCVQKTSYGDISFYATEDINSYLTVCPKGITYKCSQKAKETEEYYIIIDLKTLNGYMPTGLLGECINLNKDTYVVYINKTTYGDYRVVKYDNYFIVFSNTKDFSFNLTFKGERKNFENSDKTMQLEAHRQKIIEKSERRIKNYE